MRVGVNEAQGLGSMGPKLGVSGKDTGWGKMAKIGQKGHGLGPKNLNLEGKRNQHWVKQRPTNSEATALNMGDGKGGKIGGRMGKMGQKRHGLGLKNPILRGKETSIG